MHRLATATVAGLLTAASQWAQDRAPISQPPTNAPQKTITIPAGTRIPLSLIISIHTKLAHRGDVVHLETQYPVIVGTEIAIPAGTYVEGIIDRVTKRDSGSPTAALQMHFTRLSFTNGYEVRLDGAILQAELGSPANISTEPVESLKPAVFVHSAYLAGSQPWGFGPVGFQAHAKPTKPPKPKDPKPPPTLHYVLRWDFQQWIERRGKGPNQKSVVQRAANRNLRQFSWSSVQVGQRHQFSAAVPR